MNIICLKLVLMSAVMIVNTKATEKPASDRQLLTANLNESTLMLELKWSNILQLKNVGEVEEDCFYSGSFIEDPQSDIFVTGCKEKSIQIRSHIFGDYLGTITNNGTFEIVKDAPLKDDILFTPVYLEGPSPSSNDTISMKPLVSQHFENLENTKESPDLDCNCGVMDVECWTKCLRTPPMSPKASENLAEASENLDECSKCGDNDVECWEKCLSPPQASENLAEGCKCGDNDVECWNKCLSTPAMTPQASKNLAEGCKCRDNDVECWRKCLSDNQEPIQMTMGENIEPNSLECNNCGEMDAECWLKCLSMPMTNI